MDSSFGNFDTGYAAGKLATLPPGSRRDTRDDAGRAKKRRAAHRFSSGRPVVEERSARPARIMLVTQRVSPPQWVAMLLIAAVATIALAMIRNHDAPARLSAMAIYAGAAASFVILAHDRPFAGQSSAGSQPIAGARKAVWSVRRSARVSAVPLHG